MLYTVLAMLNRELIIIFLLCASRAKLIIIILHRASRIVFREINETNLIIPSVNMYSN